MEIQSSRQEGQFSLRDYLFVALNVEKFGEKLLPNFNIPPPLEAPFSLPSVPNLIDVYASRFDNVNG